MKKLIFTCAVLLMLVSMATAQDEGIFTIAPTDSVFAWSLPMPTEAQLAEANACRLDEDALPAEDELADFEAESACEWMVLALAHAATVGEDEPLPTAALTAYAEAVGLNPALALHQDVLFTFWNRLDNMIAIPDIAQQPITEVTIDYTFNNGEVDYTIHIAPREDGQYAASGRIHDHDPFAEDQDNATRDYEMRNMLLQPEQVAALRVGLRNFIPIGNAYTHQPCWHIFPDWDVTITFEDGSVIVLETYESNVMSAGGPWMTTIDGQSYMQVDGSFLLALMGITYDTLDLPWGHVMSYGCMNSQNALEEAFKGTSE